MPFADVKTPLAAPTTPLAAPPRLLDLLAAPDLLEIAAICDPLGARFAAEAGFEAVSLAGYAIGAHLPLSRVLDLDAVDATVRRVVAAAGVPVLVDGDIGGDAVDLVHRIESTGAAALQLANPHAPDRIPEPGLAEREAAHRALVERVGKAAAAREALLLTARCDVADDDNPALVASRIRALVEAGCDAVLVRGADATARELPAAVRDVRLILAGEREAGAAVAVQSSRQVQRWGYAAVSNKYHRCDCRRMASMAAKRG